MSAMPQGVASAHLATSRVTLNENGTMTQLTFRL
jgi:hypothetical protein